MQFSCLPSKSDRYNGVIISEKDLPKDPGEFESLLKSSLNQWNTEKRRGVWLQIPIELSSLIPIGVNQGDFSLFMRKLICFSRFQVPSLQEKLSHVGEMAFKR